MLELTIRTDKPEDLHDLLDRLQDNTDMNDDIESRLMDLHQNILRVEKKIPDPVKMWEALSEKSNKKNIK